MGKSDHTSTAHARTVSKRTYRFDQNLKDWLEQSVLKHKPKDANDPLTADAYRDLKDLFDTLIQAGKAKRGVVNQASNKTARSQSKVVGCWDDVVHDVGADPKKTLPQDSSYLAALSVYSENSSLPEIDAETWMYLLYGLHEHFKTSCLTNGASRPHGKDQNNVDVLLDHNHAKNLLEQWHDFFDLYQKVRQKQFYWKARILAFFYALTQSMVGMIAILLCVIPALPFLAASPAWAAYVISGSIGFLVFLTNFRIAVVKMQQALPCVKSARAAFWACWRSESYRKYSIIKRHTWSLVGGTILCICGAVVMAALNFGAATTEVPEFIQQVGAPALGQVGIVTAGLVIAGVVAIFELFLFIKSCVDIVHQGGFLSVIRKAFRQAMGEQSRWVKGMTVFFLALMLLSNLTGLTFIVFGSVGDVRTMLGSAGGLAGAVANVGSWAIAISAAFGMLFFFVRSALGWSYDMGQCVKYRKVIVSKLMTHWRFWLRNTVRIAGLVACIALGVSGVGWGVALAVLLTSMVANVLVAQLLKKADLHDLPNDRPTHEQDAVDVDLSVSNAPDAPINPTTLANGMGSASITGVGVEHSPMVSNVAIAPAVGTLALSSMANVHPSLLKMDMDPALPEEVIGRWVKAGKQVGAGGSAQHIAGQLAPLNVTVGDTDSVGYASDTDSWLDGDDVLVVGQFPAQGKGQIQYASQTEERPAWYDFLGWFRSQHSASSAQDKDSPLLWWDGEKWVSPNDHGHQNDSNDFDNRQNDSK